MTATMPRAPSLCNACVDGYERERAEMASAERAPCHAEQPMSQWLQIGMPTSARPVDRAQVGIFFFGSCTSCPRHARLNFYVVVGNGLTRGTCRFAGEGPGG